MKYFSRVQKVKDAAKRGGMRTGAADALGEFSELLGVLAEDSEKTADKNLRVANMSFKIAILALVIAVFSFGFQLFQFFVDPNTIKDNKIPDIKHGAPHNETKNNKTS